MSSNASHMVDVATAGNTVSSDKELASHSPEFETGN